MRPAVLRLACFLVTTVRGVLDASTPIAANLARAQARIDGLPSALQEPMRCAVQTFVRDVAAVAGALQAEGVSSDAITVTIDEILTALAPTLAEDLLPPSPADLQKTIADLLERVTQLEGR